MQSKSSKDSPFRLVEAGGGNIAGAQLLSPEGSSCPELWQSAQAMFEDACAERDSKTHFRKLMDAGQEFAKVVLAPGHHPIEKSFALNNIGLIMQALDHLPEAMKAFGFALQLNPRYATIINNYATVRMILGDHKEANEYFWKALQEDPECAEARWNSALISLGEGDFRRGWLNYEWRWKCGTFTWRQLKTKRPQWKGQDLTGKTILLTHEQGIGDSIMFIRYAKMVKARGAARVRYLCLPELVDIMKGVEGIDSITEFADINRDGTAGDEDFDYHCPLLSLPKIFKTFKEGDIPATVPYIRPQWRPCLPSLGQKKRIAIVWAGRKEHANDKNRSMALEQFAPLFDLPNTMWHSLQFSRSEGAYNFSALYTPELKNFSDTAWWLSQMDLLISVDTSVVHLAGAMARPVWVLVPISSDWRWMNGRDDSPWYPTLRIFRQTAKGDWASVIERVKGELSKL